ncbi:twin-arginine translocase subunit TatC, partial [candidate division KSB1 bacterium]
MNKKNYDDKKMPFVDHLEELRWVLIKCIIAVVVLSIGCYFFSEHIQNFLTRLYPYKLGYLGVSDAFIIRLKLSIVTGAIVGLPFIVYQFWTFIAPGLLERERKYIPIIVIFTTVCFLVGAAFAYFVIIPFGLRFLSSFQTENVVQTVVINKYLSFVVWLMIVFGLVFELPLLSAFLTKIGIINYRTLKRVRKYSIIVIFVAAAMLTPPDPQTQLFLAGPLILLYEISIFISRMIGRKKEKKEKEEEE